MGIEALTETNLEGFTGSRVKYQHGIYHNICYSDGVRYLMQNGAAWLVDAIGSHLTNRVVQRQMDMDVRMKALHFWTLTRQKVGAILDCRKDDCCPPLVKQRIQFTDCPIDIKIYAGWDTWRNTKGKEVEGWMLHLPSEY